MGGSIFSSEQKTMQCNRVALLGDGGSFNHCSYWLTMVGQMAAKKYLSKDNTSCQSFISG